MPACTFFGHRDCPAAVKPRLRSAVVELMERYGVDRFYVGCQGNFDTMVRSVLRELAETYPHISYAAVLERLPQGRREPDMRDFSDAIVPPGLETVPPRFAISKRNEWMLRQADYVVAYITHGWGGAAQCVEKAARLGKVVVNLAGT